MQHPSRTPSAKAENSFALPFSEPKQSGIPELDERNDNRFRGICNILVFDATKAKDVPTNTKTIEDAWSLAHDLLIGLMMYARHSDS